MAVAIEMNFKGATLEQYDQVLELMNLTPGGATPPGAISHWVAATDDGLRVVDVWEDMETFDRYAQEKIGPFTKQAGFEGEPEITTYDVHSYLTAEARVAAS
jgi:hypothetical protein